MADILYDTRSKNLNAPKVVILTHGDADGLVSAMVVKTFEELEDKNKSFLIMSSMDVTLEQTDKIFDYICKYTSLGSKDRVYILDGKPGKIIAEIKIDMNKNEDLEIQRVLYRKKILEIMNIKN